MTSSVCTKKEPDDDQKESVAATIAVCLHRCLHCLSRFHRIALCDSHIKPACWLGGGVCWSPEPLSCQDTAPRPRIADSSSTNAVNFSSARTTKRFPSSRCPSATKIVRPQESTIEAQHHVQAALLRLSAMISQYFTGGGFWCMCHAMPVSAAATRQSDPNGDSNPLPRFRKNVQMPHNST